jgi:uncharacterized membrane protein HdeD (DUF308 family)
LPQISTLAAGVVLGLVLVAVGVVKIVGVFIDADEAGFVWQLITGAVEVVGGLLIYLNPLKGALAITLLIALVLVAQGVAQTGFAIRTRLKRGWQWLLASALASFAGALVLVLKVPITREYEAGIIAGIALVIGGIAYGLIAYTSWKSAS